MLKLLAETKLIIVSKVSAEHSHLLLDTSPATKHPIDIDEDSGQQIHDSNSISPSNDSPPVVSGTQTQAPPSISP